MTRAMTIMANRCQVTRKSPMSNPSPGQKKLTERARLASQIWPVRVRKNTIRPTVTISCTTSGAVRRRRMIKMSRTTPSSGATSSTTTTKPSQLGRPGPSVFSTSSQYTKAENTPMPPCAKLNTPVVV